MFETLDIIDLLPKQLAARLNADCYFEDIPVVVADEGEIDATIAKKQAVIKKKNGKSGVAVVVLQLAAEDEKPDLQFGPMLLMPSFQVVENVTTNRGKGGTGKPARRVARRIRDVIKTFNIVGMISAMRTAKPNISPITHHEYGANVVMYQVDFECLETSSEVMKQVQTPQIARIPNTNTFQITCPTVGSTIFYTLDDKTFPSPQNVPQPGDSDDDKDCGDAFVYGDPVPIPVTGVTVRACAYAPGFIASAVNRATLTIN